MAGTLGAEYLHGGLTLGERGSEAGLRCLEVDIEAPGADQLPFAEARVDDDPVQFPQVLAQGVEDVEDLLVVVEVQAEHRHGDTRVRGEQFLTPCFSDAKGSRSPW
jgi:hypothetical protein